jgi:hypothetical protein
MRKAGGGQHPRPFRLDGAAAAAPNLLQFMFLEPGARELIADWPERASRLVAEFRADCGKHAGQEPLLGLIDGLARCSAEFQRLWTSQHVLGREGGVRRFRHVGPGERTFEQMTFHLAGRRDLKLVMLLPASM